MTTRIQFRRGSAAEWQKVNPTLAVAEPGFESDTKSFKIGDGTSRWSDLPPYVRADSLRSSLASAAQQQGLVASEEVRRIAVMTQEAFDRIEADPACLYVIVG